LAGTLLYRSDTMNQVLAVTDQAGPTTAVAYDGLGRRTFAGFNAVAGSGGTTNSRMTTTTG
jgi:hypothetical protein